MDFFQSQIKLSPEDKQLVENIAASLLPVYREAYDKEAEFTGEYSYKVRQGARFRAFAILVIIKQARGEPIEYSEEV